MAHPSHIPRDQVASLEAVERDALNDLCASATPNVAGELGLEHRRIDDGLVMLARKSDHIFLNRALAFGAEKPIRDAAIDEMIGTYDAAGVRSWIASVAPGAEDLQRLLAERGFSLHQRVWAKFIRGTQRADEPNTALAIREIGPTDSQEFGIVAAEVFGLPQEAVPWLAAIVGRPGWRVFVGLDGDKPVATGAAFINGKTAWLGFGATLASHRGRGGQNAILAARINVAIDAGAMLISTETGVPHPGEAGPSYNNIQRTGFRVAYERPNLQHPITPA